MKISAFEPKVAPSPYGADRRAGTRTSGAEGADASARVTLSAAATGKAEGADGSFDAEKVERIAAAIREGRFMINAGIIADRLIANAQELVGRSAR
jgi:negative regulator of flagellin synthesis FlgM